MIIKPSEVNIMKNREKMISDAYERLETRFNREIAIQIKYPYIFGNKFDFGNELDEEVHKLFCANLVKSGWYVRYKRVVRRDLDMEYWIGYNGYEYSVSDTEIPEQKESVTFWDSFKKYFKKWIKLDQ